GPTTTLTRSGERHPRVWADRDVWLPYIDILKMNLEEASSTWLGESAEITADAPRLRTEELRELAGHCLDRGVGAVCVTLDERGWVGFHPGARGGTTGGLRRPGGGGEGRGPRRPGRPFPRGRGFRFSRLPRLGRALPVRER